MLVNVWGHLRSSELEAVLFGSDDALALGTPSVISFNIDKARSEVNHRLSVLVDHGLVERVKRGYYKITERGEQYLAGDLDPDEL
jgi:DNA-binding transcriptional ArsR family regulator